MKSGLISVAQPAHYQNQVSLQRNVSPLRFATQYVVFCCKSTLYWVRSMLYFFAVLLYYLFVLCRRVPYYASEHTCILYQAVEYIVLCRRVRHNRALRSPCRLASPSPFLRSSSRVITYGNVATQWQLGNFCVCRVGNWEGVERKEGIEKLKWAIIIMTIVLNSISCSSLISELYIRDRGE